MAAATYDEQGSAENPPAILTAILGGVPNVVLRGMFYPPMALLVLSTFLIGYLDDLTVPSRARVFGAAVALPILGSAGVLVVRDYLMVPMFLLPATLIGKLPQVPKFKAEGIAKLGDFQMRSDPLKLTTSDGVAIDGMLLRNGQLGSPTPAHRFIIWFNANGVLYEQNIAFAAKYGAKLGAHVLLFNYRGVSDSGGWSSRSALLAEDGRTCIKYLEKTFGAVHDRILLHGHSMGGGTLHLLAKEYPKCFKIWDRTFWSLAATAKFMMRPELGMARVMGMVLFGYLSSVLARVIALAGSSGLGQSLFDNLNRYNQWLFLLPIGFVIGGTKYMGLLVDPVLEQMGWHIVADSQWDDRCFTIYHRRDMVINYAAASVHGWLARQEISPFAFELAADPNKANSHMYPLDTVSAEWDAVTAKINGWWSP
mmetsp:Transcript_1099/g.3149  ORF Transcript_1099/g.3149 Transcript_1099/m.3149 type:complete len:424 (+) Transcript_1099:265-1536(+)|eukprot:CAMPEP_0182929658 /NCGR_PEP_ID=MMETSP0105_2-20130417/22143_1 /TAXON_ID=81532 ORGANISM="Acanthoeca-like sp., Strain 10tr" /NCGR_SAMPLE_ID=MMETSP0105_2 /ASSEMBLY_ACC=CAM_ASM_000205 /LENGTH=423 /DNA_ID=CAMNT_0025067833 /DNA_START=186 /DNA_END=1457 /DNA_ORIENTATION=+